MNLPKIVTRLCSSPALWSFVVNFSLLFSCPANRFTLTALTVAVEALEVLFPPQYVQPCHVAHPLTQKDLLHCALSHFHTCLAGHVSAEMSAQLSRISHTLSVIFPGRPDELIGQTVITIHLNTPPSPELHVKVCTDEIHCLVCFHVFILPILLLSVFCMSVGQ